MYFQSVFGPRFFFPVKSSGSIHRYYYTKEEIINFNKDYENVSFYTINYIRENV